MELQGTGNLRSELSSLGQRSAKAANASQHPHAKRAAEFKRRLTEKKPGHPRLPAHRPGQEYMASIGVEPIRPYGQWILNPSRLPIPPRGRCRNPPREHVCTRRKTRRANVCLRTRFVYRKWRIRATRKLNGVPSHRPTRISCVIDLRAVRILGVSSAI